MAGLLEIELADDVAVVTLQRPDKRNALSIDLRVELADAFAQPRRRRSGRLHRPDRRGVGVLLGHGHQQFGGDAENRKRLVETSTSAFEAVGDCRRPVVAAVNGPALAGGFALSLLCDLRVAHSSALFGYPELPRGIPPSYASARAALPATVAQELCLTGRVVDAQEAHRLGIVREVVEDEVVDRASELARAVASLPRQAVLETKRRILLERKHLWGFLFDDEREVFRRALLGADGPDEAA